uniref:Transmembrane protein 200A n=1 Tax=Petromyzon marinus TaxID=7757 RepID=A0AAJ7X194_PETMA|nr:transmembrane protein 200A [Petromyzon marinus]
MIIFSTLFRERRTRGLDAGARLDRSDGRMPLLKRPSAWCSALHAVMSAAGALLRGFSSRNRSEGGGGGGGGGAAQPGGSKRHLRGRSRGRGRRRKYDPDVVVVKGKVRVLSFSGVFTAFGVLILVVGVAMAAIGYWPKGNTTRALSSSSTTASTASSSSTSSSAAAGNATSVTERRNGTGEAVPGPNVTSSATPGRTSGPEQGFLAAQLHSYRMKVLGPLTMGIGIFIFICGIAALYENRDRETKVIHLRDIYSAIIDTHHHHHNHRSTKGAAAPSRGHVNGLAGRQGADQIARCYDAQCAARLTASMLLTLPCAISDPKFSADLCDDLRHGDPLGILGAPFRGGRSGSLYTIHSETCPRSPRSPRSPREEKGLPSKASKAPCRATSIVSSSITAFTLPVIKLNNCVIDDAGDLAVAPPHRSDVTAESGGGDGDREKARSLSLVDVSIASGAQGQTEGSPAATDGPESVPEVSPYGEGGDADVEKEDVVPPLRVGSGVEPSEQPKVASSTASSPPASSPTSSPSSYRPMKRQYSNKEKLIMISRLNRNVSFEVEEEFVRPASPPHGPNPSETHL